VRVALFDWTHGGHHAIYLRRFAEVLAGHADVVIAASDATIEQVADVPAETFSLGPSRPDILGAGLRRADRRVLARELALFEDVDRRAAADHLLHVYADALLPRLLLHRRFRTPVSILLFYPRAHYARAFGTPLGRADRAKANAKEVVIAAWRRRADAHAVLTLDEELVRRWSAKRGAPAYWLPEPTVPRLDLSDRERKRSGCILYGALADRKGIDLVAEALTLEPTAVRLTIAGEAPEAFRPALDRYVREMVRSGVEVDLRARRHEEEEGLLALASAKCALLPYPQHDGMSRVLVEACSVGTPVVVHDRGLLGHLVRAHGIGLAVDCRDAPALREGILELAGENADTTAYDDALARFAARFSEERFETAAIAPFRRRP
jgi:glycosyltransferase involved in cell wall biosynthesis